MFSFYINNPNNFIIQKDFTAIPLGPRCTSAIACKYASIRHFSLPFDWIFPLLPKKVQSILENNFNDYIPDVHNGIFHNKYDIELVHFNSNKHIGIEEYKRRIERFNNIINSPKHIYFVFINEDYLYNTPFRQEEFTERTFQEMLELEIFLKCKYPNINYNILYFNFKHHDIPTNSNIINIVLSCNANAIAETDRNYPFDEFRTFCGNILSNLFNTNITSRINYNELFID